MDVYGSAPRRYCPMLTVVILVESTTQAFFWRGAAMVLLQERGARSSKLVVDRSSNSYWSADK